MGMSATAITAATPIEATKCDNGNFQLTDAGLIPVDWRVAKVSTLCRLVNGRGFKPFEWQTRGYPIIRIQNLNGSDEFNHFNGSYDKKIEVQPGQLLFAWSGSRGTSFGPHIWHGPLGLLNYHTWKVVVDEAAVSPRFFFHALKGLTGFIEGQAHGASALVHVQKWQMEGFQLVLPQLAREQEAIADALSDADALIESLETLIAKKRAIKQGAMQDLLSGRKRLPDFSGEWQRRKIGAIADTDPENLSSSTSVEYSFNYIALEDVDKGRLLSWSERRFGSAPSRARRKLRSGDILFGTVRPNLMSHYQFVESSGEWVCSTGFCVVRCRPGEAIPAYVFNHLFADDITRQIDMLTRVC